MNDDISDTSVSDQESNKKIACKKKKIKKASIIT